jgi:hypothetical protein
MAADNSETSVTIYQYAHRHIAEDCKVNFYYRLESLPVLYFLVLGRL